MRFRAVLAICLALGLAVTVGMAWVCALRFDQAVVSVSIVDESGRPAATAAELDDLRSHPIATRFSDNQLVVGVETVFGAERRVAKPLPYWLVTTAQPGTRWVGSIASADVLEVRIRSGWPTLSMEGRRGRSHQAPADASSGGEHPAFTHHWLLGIGSMDVVAGDGTRLAIVPRAHLPLKPLWPGFALNTLLYAALAWFVMFAPFALRRAVRRRRNCCERCGYPRGASDVCSECGAMLRPRA